MIKELAEWIAAQTGMVIGTNLIVGHTWPTHQNRCCLLKEHTGSALYPDLPDRADFMLQVLSRGDTYFNARDDAYTIYDAIYKNRKGPVTLGTGGVELFPAGQFEDWNNANDVKGFSETNYDGGSFSRDNTNQRSGNYCGKISTGRTLLRPTNEAGYPYPSLTDGKKYRFSMWTKSNKDNAISYLCLQVVGENIYLRPYSNLWKNNTGVGTPYYYFDCGFSSYRQFFVDFDFNIDGSGLAKDVYFYLMIYVEGVGKSLWIDDFSFKELDTYVAMTCHATTTPQYLGEDDRKRHLFSTNYRFQIRDYNNG
jgi:hypothetical protein